MKILAIDVGTDYMGWVYIKNEEPYDFDVIKRQRKGQGIGIFRGEGKALKISEMSPAILRQYRKLEKRNKWKMITELENIIIGINPDLIIIEGHNVRTHFQAIVALAKFHGAIERFLDIKGIDYLHVNNLSVKGHFSVSYHQYTHITSPYMYDKKGIEYRNAIKERSNEMKKALFDQIHPRISVHIDNSNKKWKDKFRREWKIGWNISDAFACYYFALDTGLIDQFKTLIEEEIE